MLGCWMCAVFRMLIQRQPQSCVFVCSVCLCVNMSHIDMSQFLNARMFLEMLFFFLRRSNLRGKNKVNGEYLMWLLNVRIRPWTALSLQTGFVSASWAHPHPLTALLQIRALSNECLTVCLERHVKCVSRRESDVDACKPPPSLLPVCTRQLQVYHRPNTDNPYSLLRCTFTPSRSPPACLSFFLSIFQSSSHTHTYCGECNLGSPVCVDRWLMSLWMLKKWFTVQRESALCMMMSWWV